MKQQVGPGVMIAVIAVVVIVVGAVAYKTFFASTKHEDTRATDQRYQQYMKGATSSGGAPGGMQGSPGAGPPGGGAPGSGGPPTSGGQ